MMAKLGIHSKDWDKLIQAIKEQIPEPYASKVIKLLEVFSTSYL
jgi:hypothetical protein